MDKIKRIYKITAGALKIIANWPNFKEMKRGIESVIDALRR
jgi:hypothetical protein